MRKMLTLLIALTVYVSVHAQAPAPAEKGSQYGATVTAAGAISPNDIEKETKNSQFTGKIKGKVTDVCLKKGCWMKIKRDNGDNIMVTFKDYGFFMPANIVDKEVVVEGTAEVKPMSVKDQKHYAADAHMSKEDIDKIKAPKKEVQFVADGVLVM